MHGGQEQRRNVLTDNDVERIKNMMVAERTAWAESIGFDVSTPRSRLEIRKDNEFTRNMRRAKNKLITVVFTGIGGSVALWAWIWDNVSGKGHHGP